MLYISPNLVAGGSRGPAAQSLGQYAVIGWENLVKSATVTATSQRREFPAVAVKNPLTYERWSPTGASGGTITIDLGGSVLVEYIGIAAHNFGTLGTEVRIECSVGGVNWLDVITLVPTTDNAILVAGIPEELISHIRITVSNGAEIGVVYAGRLLSMQRKAYGGHSPGTLSRKTEIEPNTSESGQFLGRSIVRKGFETSFNWRHLTADWYRQYFDPFVEHALREPFFIAWYPEKFPDEVLYAWTKDDIWPVNMGVRDYMQVGFSVEAL